MQAATKKVVKKAAPVVEAEVEATEAPAKRGPGRPRNTESNLPDDVNELLELLAATEDQAEKRRIRARLRSRGHRGGLKRQGAEGEAAAPAKAAKVAAPAKKKPAPRIQEEEASDDE